VQRTSIPIHCKCGVISRHITTRVFPFVVAAEYLLLLCLKLLIDVPVLFEDVTIDFGADVEDVCCCFRIEFGACIFVSHCV